MRAQSSVAEEVCAGGGMSQSAHLMAGPPGLQLPTPGGPLRSQPVAAVHKVPAASNSATSDVEIPMPQTVKCSCPACIASVDVFVVSAVAELESVQRTNQYKKIVGRNDLAVVTCAVAACMRRFYYNPNCVRRTEWWNPNLLTKSGSKGYEYFLCKEHA